MNSEQEENAPLPTVAATSANPPAPAGRWPAFWVCILLTAITLAVFGQTAWHDFINYDDSSYVYENPMVKAGLTLKGTAAAFHINRFDYWVPLTTLSHMLDCQLYGINPGGHHMTNVLLHVGAVIFLFLALWRMTGDLWRPAFVAALFAIHPLHVESVAWLAERKDVLSGLFFMMALGAYSAEIGDRRWKMGRWPVLVFFVLGLMAKPMVVTLPFILLLLDYWPLGRKAEVDGLQSSIFNLQSSLRQKLPLLALVPLSCWLTVFAQSHTPHAIQSLESFSIPARTGNALVSYVAYIGQMLYPSDLVIFYSRPEHGYPLWEPIAAFLLLAGITLGVFLLRKKCPCLIVGWLWYLGMLAPVIGFIQVGFQARADRYTYLPQIGLYMMLAWGMTELLAGWRYRRVILGASAAMVIGVLACCAGLQTAYWKNSETLWTHTLSCNPESLLAHNNLGGYLLKNGRVDEALAHYQKALEIHPRFADAQFNLGMILYRKGKIDEAMAHYEKAIEIQPDFAEAQNNLGNILRKKGKMDEAMAHFQKAVEADPEYALAHYNLGKSFLMKGEMSKAMTEYKRAMEIQPEFAAKTPVVQKDIAHIAWVLATSPDSTIRNGTKSIELAEQTDHLSHGTNVMVIGALAAGYAEAGRFSEAVATAQRALQQTGNQNKPALATGLQEQLNAYQKSSPWREGAQH